MELKKNYKFWFATGSQDLYGDECLSHVAKHAQIIVQNFNESGIVLRSEEHLKKQMQMKNVPVSSHGCTHSPQQNHGSQDYRHLRNHYYIFTHSLMKKSHMTRLIWIL